MSKTARESPPRPLVLMPLVAAGRVVHEQQERRLDFTRAILEAALANLDEDSLFDLEDVPTPPSGCPIHGDTSRNSPSPTVHEGSPQELEGGF